MMKATNWPTVANVNVYALPATGTMAANSA